MPRSKFFIKFLFLTLLGVGLAEAYFSLTRTPAPGEAVEAAIADDITRSFFEPKTSVYTPPFTIFSNQGCEDSARMKMIDEFARHPLTEVRVRDFLSRGKTFTVKTNALGFRGPARSLAKPYGVRRVLLLGSYMAFGQGLEWENTLAAQLEEELNAQGKDPYEVWAVGLPSSTLIMTLGFYLNEGKAMGFDLILVDSGQVDLSMPYDLVFKEDLAFRKKELPEALLRKKGTLFRVYAWFMRQKALQKSEVIKRTLALFKPKDTGRRAWEQCLAKLKQAAGEVPVVMINQPANYKETAFREVADTLGLGFWDIKTLLPQTAASASPGEDLRRNLLSIQNHMDYLRTHEFLKSYAGYMANYYQFNALGTRSIAKALSSMINFKIVQRLKN